jgi:hypothetical protein
MECHPERSEGSLAMGREMLRCAQHDRAGDLVVEEELSSSFEPCLNFIIRILLQNRQKFRCSAGNGDSVLELR